MKIFSSYFIVVVLQSLKVILYENSISEVEFFR